MQKAWPCSRILSGLHCSSPIRPCPIAPGKEFRPTTKFEEVVSHKTVLTFNTNCMSGGVSKTALSLDNFLERLREFSESYETHSYDLLQGKDTN